VSRVKIAAIALVVIGTVIVVVTIRAHSGLALLGSALAAVGLMVHAALEDRGARW
jgi:hypothetical protein